MFIHLDTMPQCDKQTDGRTDGRTDSHNWYNNVAIYMLTRSDAR